MVNDKNTRRTTFPLRLNLQEVSEQPKTYTSDSTTGELRPALKDLIGSNPYSVELEIQRAGNVFLAKGHVETKMPLICSDCSGEYNEPVSLHFQEVVVVNSPLEKGDQSTKANHSHEWDEGQPQCTYLDSMMFDLGEFLHEQIALTEPSRPTGSSDPQHACEDVKSQVQREWLSIGSDSTARENSPFKALEGLKLKS